MEIKLSPIKMVDPGILIPNPLNERFFQPVTGPELDSLAADIKVRGVIIPLISKNDGVLLAGHRRRQIAILMKISKVPVQYVLTDLTEEQETAFILKDNLLRRHLTPTERRLLYNLACEDFEEKVQNKNSKLCGVNTKDIAEKTGINPKTVDYDVLRIRRDKEKSRIDKSVIDVANEKEIDMFKKAAARMLNVATLGSLATCKEYLKIVKDSEGRLETLIQNIEIRNKPADKKASLKK